MGGTIVLTYWIDCVTILLSLRQSVATSVVMVVLKIKPQTRR